MELFYNVTFKGSDPLPFYLLAAVFISLGMVRGRQILIVCVANVSKYKILRSGVNITL